MTQRRHSTSQVRHTHADSANDASTVAPRLPRVARICAENIEHVAEVQAHGSHIQRNAPVTWRRDRTLLRHDTHVR
eukprot:scaffold328122_cov137-Tisochrysis_lutea.AAC.1